jgi:hypothetical protein
MLQYASVFRSIRLELLRSSFIVHTLYVERAEADQKVVAMRWSHVWGRAFPCDLFAVLVVYLSIIQYQCFLDTGNPLLPL